MRKLAVATTLVGVALVPISSATAVPIAPAAAVLVFAGSASASTTVTNCAKRFFGLVPHLSAIRINIAPVRAMPSLRGLGPAGDACFVAALVQGRAQYDSEHGGLPIRFVDNDVVFKLTVPPTGVWTVGGQEVRRHDGGANIVCVAIQGRQEVDFTIVGPPGSGLNIGPTP
jgi:hypothetical protein